MKEKKNTIMKRLSRVFSNKKLKSFFADKIKRRIVISLSVAAVCLLCIVVAGAIYVNDYYRIDAVALEEFCSLESIKNATFEIDEDGVLTAIPSEAKAGLIFYPGGKVEYTAYLPLMLACAEKGILCVLTPMPLNLAVLDVNAADGIRERYPSITRWYIGGHSLGGSMAASYLSKNIDNFDGLILLGSYSTADVTESRVLSIYGSEDGVMNREKYEKYKANLPSILTEIIIDGGNHANFGLYGRQDGDGSAEIDAFDQIFRTADAIYEFISEEK